MRIDVPYALFEIFSSEYIFYRQFISIKKNCTSENYFVM